MVNSLGTRSAEHGPRPADVAAARAAIPTIDAAVLVPDIKRAILEVVATSHSARTLGTSRAGHQHCALVALVRLRGRIRTRTKPVVVPLTFACSCVALAVCQDQRRRTWQRSLHRRLQHTHTVRASRCSPPGAARPHPPPHTATRCRTAHTACSRVALAACQHGHRRLCASTRRAPALRARLSGAAMRPYKHSQPHTSAHCRAAHIAGSFVASGRSPANPTDHHMVGAATLHASTINITAAALDAIVHDAPLSDLALDYMRVTCECTATELRVAVPHVISSSVSICNRADVKRSATPTSARYSSKYCRSMLAESLTFDYLHTRESLRLILWLSATVALIATLIGGALVYVDQCVACAILGPSAKSTLLSEACNGIQLALHPIATIIAVGLEALASYLSSLADRLDALDLDAALLTSIVGALETFERLLFSVAGQLDAFDREFDGCVSRCALDTQLYVYALLTSMAASLRLCLWLALDAISVEQAVDRLEALASYLSSLADRLDACGLNALLMSMVGAMETLERLLSSVASQMDAFDRAFDGRVRRCALDTLELYVYVLLTSMAALRLALDALNDAVRYVCFHLHVLAQLAMGALFHHFNLSEITLIVVGTQIMSHVMFASPIPLVEMLTLVLGIIAVTPDYRIIYLDDGRHDPSFQCRQAEWRRHYQAMQQYKSYVAWLKRKAHRQQWQRRWRFWNGKGGGTASFTSSWQFDLSRWQQATLDGDLGKPHLIEVFTRVIRPFPRLNEIEGWKRCGRASHLPWSPPSPPALPPSLPLHQCEACKALSSPAPMPPASMQSDNSNRQPSTPLPPPTTPSVSQAMLPSAIVAICTERPNLSNRALLNALQEAHTDWPIGAKQVREARNRVAAQHARVEPPAQPSTEWQRHEDAWRRDEAIDRSRRETSSSPDLLPVFPEPTTSELIDQFVSAELDATGVDLVAAQLAHECACTVDSATNDPQPESIRLVGRGNDPQKRKQPDASVGQGKNQARTPTKVTLPNGPVYYLMNHEQVHVDDSPRKRLRVYATLYEDNAPKRPTDPSIGVSDVELANVPLQYPLNQMTPEARKRTVKSNNNLATKRGAGVFERMLKGEAGPDPAEKKFRTWVGKQKPRPENGNPFRDRHDHNKKRREDDNLRRQQAERRRDEKTGRPASAHWMADLRAPTGDDTANVTNLQRLQQYQDILHNLGERVHTCARCRQRAHDHGTTDPTAWCWGCEANPKLMPWWNGLDLEVGCKPIHEEMHDAEQARASDSNRDPLILTEDETFTNVSGVSWESRREWQRLQAKYGPLTPLEEALICRVTACTTVLKLPSERQLGYKGNIINLVNDLATVRMQLPLAPKDSGFVYYQVEGQDSKGNPLKPERVRKFAVRDYLKFFSEHHAVYRDGIRNPRAQPGDADEYIVPPFVWKRDFNEQVPPHNTLTERDGGERGVTEREGCRRERERGMTVVRVKVDGGEGEEVRHGTVVTDAAQDVRGSYASSITLSEYNRCVLR